MWLVAADGVGGGARRNPVPAIRRQTSRSDQTHMASGIHGQVDDGQHSQPASSSRKGEPLDVERELFLRADVHAGRNIDKELVHHRLRSLVAELAENQGSSADATELGESFFDTILQPERFIDTTSLASLLKEARAHIGQNSVARGG